MQKQLMDPGIKGTLNVLEAAHKAKVKRLVLTSSVSAFVPNPKWPADTPLDETSWTDIDYCKQNGIWYPVAKTLVEKVAWEFSKEKGLDVVAINPRTTLGPILSPDFNASLAMIVRLVNASGVEAKATLEITTQCRRQQ
ncbi:phenylacetaldehyde reductase-like isoform X1 [Cryptomeria japonica]|uniref:phenylacetaldehyde reductase-like isoform X1 n=2 Tax=Cryptomeria japonica TaxID=3369 RepID=UPI0027DA5E75|nr:phenylacetaldehyde reductase-like isoform X1 [Cryptomeria japonica]